MFELSNAGDQVPSTPLSEVVGKAANASPEQIGSTCVNVGITLGLNVIVTKSDAEQTPIVLVKV